MKRKSTEAIKVVIRLRPLLQPYEDEEIWAVDSSQNTIYTVVQPNSNLDISQSSLNTMKERDVRRRYAETLGHQSISFDHAYGPESRTSDIYTINGRPVIQSVMDGYNGSIFMYGQTTSGKTYTMIGTPDLPGILPCAIKHIFQHVNSDKALDWNIWVSYLEIYNESINDLLVPGSNNLQVKEDGKQGVTVARLKQQQVWNFDQVIILMNYGEEHRAYRETNIHEHSSRSHTIFKVFIHSKSRKDGLERNSCLNLIDLAGSERLNEFEIRGSDQMGETGHINKSLFILANVVNKLAEGKNTYIPYRDSKLTRILRSSLGGNSLSTIICTISPAAMNYHLTLSTLRFATRAKIVHNKPVVNEVIDDQAVAEQYRDEIARLREGLSKAGDMLIAATADAKKFEDNAKRTFAEAQAMAQELAQLHNMRESDRRRADALEAELSHSGKGDMSFLKNEHEQDMAVLEAENYRLRSQQYPSNSQFELLLQRAQTQDSSIEWQEELERLRNHYKQSVQQMEAQCIEMLKNSAATLCPEFSDSLQPNAEQPQPDSSIDIPAQEIIELIDSGEVFKNLSYNFSEILDEFIQSGGTSSSDHADHTINRIKHVHDEVTLAADDRLEHARTQLEIFYRDQLSETSTPNSPLNLTEEHSEKLQNLRNQYEDFLDEVETAFVEALRQFEEWMSANEYQSENEPHSYGIRPISADIVTYIWGSGKDGRCGLGNDDNMTDPTRLLFDPQTFVTVKKVACGYHHSAAISAEGVLYTWGRGVFGQLGHYNNESYNTPVKVNSLYQNPVVQVACGWQHTAALTSDGALYTWGYGEDGQLGHGDANDYIVPKKVEGVQSRVSSLSWGHSHTACVVDGVLFTWGWNPDSRLFQPDTDSRLAPSKVPFDCAVSMVSLGVSHSAALMENGTVVMAGLGQEGQLGYHCEQFTHANEVRGFGTSNPAAEVAWGDCYTLIRDASGSVWAFGKGSHGRLGLGDDDNRYEPTRINIDGITSISAGCRHAGAVTRGGKAYLWGFNFYNQLGVEGDRDLETPTELPLSGIMSLSWGYFHSGAICEERE